MLRSRDMAYLDSTCTSFLVFVTTEASLLVKKANEILSTTNQ